MSAGKAQQQTLNKYQGMILLTHSEFIMILRSFGMGVWPSK